MSYKQSHPDPAQREIIFHMSKADNSPDTGLVFVAGDLKIRKPRAFGAAANSSLYVNVNATQLAAVVELAEGDYIYTFTQAEFDTPGMFSFKAHKGAGIVMTITDQIDRAYFGAVQAGTLTTAAFTCDRLDAAAAHWKNALVTFHTGALAGQVAKVGGFTPGAPALLTLATGYAFTGAPAAGDIYELVNK